MLPAPHLPAIEVAERSDPGRDPEKQVNEDVAVCVPTRFGHLCAVCDGMGGHAAGREAAELAVAVIVEAFERVADGTPPAEVLRTAIQLANSHVYGLRTSEVGAGRPGCTVAAVLIHTHGTEVAHVGDSRVYRVHEAQVFRVTRDHSVVQELVDRGLLTAQQAAAHPDANRITRAVGVSPTVDVEVRSAPIHHVAGDVFVLCSDGLSDLVDDSEILAIVPAEPAAQSAGKLVDLANARGGHDNITVLVIRMRESASAPSQALAPTLAQTNAPALAPPTVIESVPSAPTEILPVSASSPSRPLEPTPVPATRSRADRRALVGVLSGVALAFVAAGLLGTVIVHELSERRGKRNSLSEATSAAPSVLGALASVDAGADGASTTIAPERVELPVPGTTAPIAPLEPSPPEPRKRKR